MGRRRQAQSFLISTVANMRGLTISAWSRGWVRLRLYAHAHVPNKNESLVKMEALAYLAVQPSAHLLKSTFWYWPLLLTKREWGVPFSASFLAFANKWPSVLFFPPLLTIAMLFSQFQWCAALFYSQLFFPNLFCSRHLRFFLRRWSIPKKVNIFRHLLPYCMNHKERMSPCRHKMR